MGVFPFFCVWELRRRDGWSLAGKEKAEDGAVMDRVLGAADGQSATVALYDAMRDPETQAGAVEVFGGVEGLEEAVEHVRGHAVAGICDGEAHAATTGGACRGVMGADARGDRRCAWRRSRWR